MVNARGRRVFEGQSAKYALLIIHHHPLEQHCGWSHNTQAFGLPLPAPPLTSLCPVEPKMRCSGHLRAQVFAEVHLPLAGTALPLPSGRTRLQSATSFAGPPQLLLSLTPVWGANIKPGARKADSHGAAPSPPKPDRRPPTSQGPSRLGARRDARVRRTCSATRALLRHQILAPAAPCGAGLPFQLDRRQHWRRPVPAPPACQPACICHCYRHTPSSSASAVHRQGPLHLCQTQAAAAACCCTPLPPLPAAAPRERSHTNPMRQRHGC